MPLLLVGTLAACGGNDGSAATDGTSYEVGTEVAHAPGTCVCTPVVRSIRVVPGKIEVRPGSTFELRARLFDANGVEIPEWLAYSPYWTVSEEANVNIVRRDGHRVVLEVPDEVTVDRFDVVAEAGASPVASTAATARIIKDAPPSDHIVADLNPYGLPLLVALAADQAASSSWEVGTHAFSGFADLGDLRTPGALMIFSADHAMGFAEVAWSAPPPNEVIRYQTVDDGGGERGDNAAPGSGLTPKPVLKKDVTIWIDPGAGDDQFPATTAADIARIHLADVNETFKKNRVGVEFNLKGIYRITTGSPTADCGEWNGEQVHGESLAGGSNAKFDPTGGPGSADNTNAIDVFVIDMGNGTASQCYEAGRPEAPINDQYPGYRIFLPAGKTLPHLLGHELGHTLLDGSDDVDHTDAASIGATNLLNQATTEGAVRRTHVSIGQACRMNRSAVVTKLRTDVGLLVPDKCPPVRKDVP